MGRSRAPWGHVRKLPSGRYQASYLGPHGDRHNAPATFTAKADAQAWLAVQRARLIEGVPMPPPAPIEPPPAPAAETLGKYGARWIEDRLTSKGLPLRESTKQGYRKDLRNLGPKLLRLPLTAITPDIVEAWYRKALATGKRTSVAHQYALLKTIMTSARRQGIIDANPCDIVGAATIRTDRETVPPDDAELAIIVANTPSRYQALVVLAAWSALRWGEQTELRRADIEDDGEQIRLKVRRGVTYVDGRYIVGPPKTTRSKRDVVLPPGASDVVRDHLNRYVPEDPDALLFPGPAGVHLHIATRDEWWHPARTAIGRTNLTWHDLRHYGLTQYARAGATLAELMGRGGHTVVATAMRYQAATGRDAELARRMESGARQRR